MRSLVRTRCGDYAKQTHSNEAPSVEVDDVVRTASGLLHRSSVAMFLWGLLEKTTKCVDSAKVGSGFRQNIQVLPGGSTVAVDPGGEGPGCLSLGRLGAAGRQAGFGFVKSYRFVTTMIWYVVCRVDKMQRFLKKRQKCDSRCVPSSLYM